MLFYLLFFFTLRATYSFTHYDYKALSASFVILALHFKNQEILIINPSPLQGFRVDFLSTGKYVLIS